MHLLVFNFIYNIFYLVYSNGKDSILIYNIINSQKINEIKKKRRYKSWKNKASFRQKNKRDLIIALYSLIFPSIYIWNILNCECIINIRENDFYIHLNDICILNEKKTDSIFLCFYEYYLKEYDFKGKLKKVYKNYSHEKNYHMYMYYDDETKNNFIITSNISFIKSYIYNKGKYYKYEDSNDNKEMHYEPLIYKSNGKKKLIEGSHLGIIRIWDFHSTSLLKIIKLKEIKNFIYMCVWNEKYVSFGKTDGLIEILDITTGKILKKLKGHKNEVINIRKINIPQ